MLFLAPKCAQEPTVSSRRDVVFQTRILTHYRMPFHEAVRQKLASNGINYRLIVGKPMPNEAAKGDIGHLQWQENVRSWYLGGSRAVFLESPKLKANDLLIIGQESSILSNYHVQAMRCFGGPIIAFFGHGRNFQSSLPNGMAEKFKKFWVRRVDWWFAYTDESARVVEAAGFDRAKITVFNNSIDTKSIELDISCIENSERELLRKTLFGGSNNIGIYVGGLYDLKRVSFLLAAAKSVRALIPDFQLAVIGGGVDRQLVQQAAAQYNWIHALGPKFGREKAVIASLANVMLMPGLIGLGVLDAFAYSAPIVTTAVPYHSPEIAYLKDGYNGIVVQDVDDVDGYARRVADVLTDSSLRVSLQGAGRESLSRYSIEQMANRFSEGVMQALHTR